MVIISNYDAVKILFNCVFISHNNLAEELTLKKREKNEQNKMDFSANEKVILMLSICKSINLLLQHFMSSITLLK